MTTTRDERRPAIARIWRGRTEAAKAAEYLYEHGVKPLAAKALGVQVLEIVTVMGRTG